MEPTTPAPRPVPSRPGPGGAGILIVEDEPELVRALRINLRARQYDVRTAGTGREALAAAASHPPDAIILDLGLPGVRAAHQLPPVPHGTAAPQIGGQPGASPAPAHRTGDGVPLPALTPG
jgi:hypothetical protein